mmetsp:Transcript_1598/g.6309  ORF Transcript_1598/g.6309 Transcript_1598/m.6309 type:complete len:231 (+) Transcript_1598:354-1046(+)
MRSRRISLNAEGLLPAPILENDVSPRLIRKRVRQSNPTSAVGIRSARASGLVRQCASASKVRSNHSEAPWYSFACTQARVTKRHINAFMTARAAASNPGEGFFNTLVASCSAISWLPSNAEASTSSRACTSSKTRFLCTGATGDLSTGALKLTTLSLRVAKPLALMPANPTSSDWTTSASTAALTSRGSWARSEPGRVDGVTISGGTDGVTMRGGAASGRNNGCPPFGIL